MSSGYSSWEESESEEFFFTARTSFFRSAPGRGKPGLQVSGAPGGKSRAAPGSTRSALPRPDPLQAAPSAAAPRVPCTPAARARVLAIAKRRGGPGPALEGARGGDKLLLPKGAEPGRPKRAAVLGPPPGGSPPTPVTSTCSCWTLARFGGRRCAPSGAVALPRAPRSGDG